MRTQTLVKGDFRRVHQERKQGSGKNRKCAPWRGSKPEDEPLNRAVVLMWLIAITFAGSDENLVHFRHWSKFGLTAEALTRELEFTMPGIIAYFEKLTKRPWNARNAFNRLYVCYWQAHQTKPRDCYSTEHPKNHAALSSKIDDVRAYYERHLPVPLFAV